MLIDLHTHSDSSDGTESPAELIGAAQRAGLDVVALTDHDTTAGWDAAARAALDYGVGLIRGAEISSQYHGITVHLLCYLHDRKNARLAEQMELTRTSRLSRAMRMVGLLSADFDLEWSDVLAQTADHTTIGRPHIADALVANGVVANRSEAFGSILRNGSKYYVRHYAPQVLDAIELVLDAGGVPVLAHPGASNRGRIVDNEAIAAMVDAGLAGLEVYHRDNDAAQRERLRSLAKHYGLLVTGSSDYHGAGKPNRLGENWTSAEVLDEILERSRGAGMVHG